MSRYSQCSCLLLDRSGSSRCRGLPARRGQALRPCRPADPLPIALCARQRTSEPAGLRPNGRIVRCACPRHQKERNRTETEASTLYILSLPTCGRKTQLGSRPAPCDWHASQSEAMRSVRNGFECAVRALPLWWLQLLCCAHQAIGNDNMRPRSGGKWRSSLPILPSFARPRPLRIKRHARFIDDRATRLSRAGRWRCYRHGG